MPAEAFFEKFIEIFKTTKAYTQSLDTMNKIVHDPDYIAAQKQWHHAETPEQKIDIAKTYLMKNSTTCAYFATPLWCGTTDSQLRWSEFFFNDPAVVIITAVNRDHGHGQDEIYDTYSRWLRVAIGWSLRGSSDFYKEKIIIQAFQNNGVQTLNDTFWPFIITFSNQLTTFILQPDLSASSLAFTFIHCCSELFRKGVHDPHTFLWQRRSRMVRRFLKAGEAEKERMIRMKIGSSTVIHTFAQLVRDDIINHLYSERSVRDEVWVLLYMDPFNLLAQGNFRLLLNAILEATGYVATKQHIEAIPVEALLNFIKSEHFGPTLLRQCRQIILVVL